MTTTDLMNISAFTGLAPADAFKILDPNAESLADGIGSSYGIIGYKGKVWTLRLRGETYQFTRPDDGSPAAFLDVIVLRAPSYKSKSYFPAGSFQDGQIGTRPTCDALNGETPDADILTPQATSCAICPRNAFKLNAEGRRSRECSDYKRLAVLILPSQSKALLGAALMEPVFLRVPAASLNDLAMLGEGMQARGFHYSTYITRIGFNPEKPHPQMTFRALQALTNKEGPVVLPLREDATAKRITGEDEIGRPRPQAAAVPAATVAPTISQQAQATIRPPQNVTANVVPMQPRPAPAPQPVSVDTGFGDVTATVTPHQVATPANPPAQPSTVDTGFGDVGGAPAPAAPVAAPTAFGDMGEPEDSDADLDARVAALLPK